MFLAGVVEADGRGTTSVVYPIYIYLLKKVFHRGSSCNEATENEFDTHASTDHYHIISVVLLAH